MNTALYFMIGERLYGVIKISRDSVLKVVIFSMIEVGIILYVQIAGVTYRVQPDVQVTCSFSVHWCENRRYHDLSCNIYGKIK